MNRENHYPYLEKNFQTFLNYLNIKGEWMGFIVAHGDKCYGYKEKWERANIPFKYGVAVYLLTHIPPYSNEVRQTKSGWVDPGQWVIDNMERFISFLPL